MFYTSLHKSQTAFTVVSAILNYVLAATLIQLGSLTMLIQEAAYAYPEYIPDSNENLLESNAVLVQHSTGLLQDHYMSPVSIAYLSPVPYSFPTPLPSYIIPQGHTSVTKFSHKNSKSDLPSTFPYSFPSNIPSNKPISYPPSATSEFTILEYSRSSISSSRFPSLATLQYPHNKTGPYPS